LTTCKAISDTRMLPTGGCSYEVVAGAWDAVAQTNRGGDPVRIQVRATDDGQSCVAASGARPLLISSHDIIGRLYYWQSVTVGGTPGRTGGIYRYDFGKRNQPVDAFLTADSTRCIGCHFLSRDGQKMTYARDDSDADDEYGDVLSQHLDV